LLLLLVMKVNENVFLSKDTPLLAVINNNVLRFKLIFNN
jgi:hypothetical protein